MFNIYLLIVCVCEPLCHSSHVEAWGQLAGVPSLLLWGFQLCGKLPRLLSHLSGCLSFTTQSGSFLLCSVIPFILTVGLQWCWHCGVKRLHLKPCLPLSFQKHLIFSSSLMETVSTISSSAEQWCPVASALSTLNSTTKERLQAQRSQAGLLLLPIAVCWTRAISFPSSHWMRILHPSPLDSSS